MFFRVDERDIRFVMFEHLEVQKLLQLSAFAEHSQETFEMVLSEAAKFARDVLHPINVPGDREGCRFENGNVRLPRAFKEAYQQYRDAGWNLSDIAPEHGGQGLPLSLMVAATEAFIGACPSFMVTPALARGCSHLIESFGTEEMKKTYCDKMYSGEWGGTMCLTEPQAGSAVGDAKTTAKKVGDHYLITGNKIFITSGEQDLTKQIIHAVLARVEGAPAGIKGISLFIVPKYLVNADGSLGERNDMKCVGIEEKMGIHGSATCSLAFGEEGRCVGYLLGRENEGIKLMFQMMNEARIEVGLQGLGIAAQAYEIALDYAKQRVQGTDAAAFKDANAPRVPIVKHPDVRRMLLSMKGIVEGLRALMFRAAMYADLARHAEGDERKKYQGFLDLLTPICKAYGSEMGFRATDLAMLCLGGYGYIREYGVEQHMRDVKIASIYEGTNGIQAMDLLGRKVGMNGGLVLMQFVQEVNNFIDANKSHAKLGALVTKLEEARDALFGVTMKFQELQMNGDIYYPLLHASHYLLSFGDFVLAWSLLEQAVIADRKLADLSKGKVLSRAELAANSEARFYDAKVKTAEFFVHNQLPEIHARAAVIHGGSRAALDIVMDGETI
jgi:hypothetical protein